ncbi:hypothetical protein B7R74_14620, partial [Yersinia pseudotuberculosis]|uniref:hypothetical protein n=1 Tax=Yersinia pseudotuberculosis TaxID=633 RepID=UPI000D0BA782
VSTPMMAWMEQEKRYFYWLPILFAAGIWSSTSETSLFVIDILFSLLFCSSRPLSEETVGIIDHREKQYGYGLHD